MKRYGYLWDEIVDFKNLLAAARQAQRGKRFRGDRIDCVGCVSGAISFADS